MASCRKLFVAELVTVCTCARRLVKLSADDGLKFMEYSGCLLR